MKYFSGILQSFTKTKRNRKNRKNRKPKKQGATTVEKTTKARGLGSVYFIKNRFNMSHTDTVKFKLIFLCILVLNKK